MFRTAVLVLTACVLSLPESYATELPPEVLQSFQANQQALSGLLVKGTIKGRFLVPFEEARPLLGPWIQSAEQLEQTQLFRISTDGIRFDEQNFMSVPGSDEYRPLTRSAFNGKKLFRGFVQGAPDEQLGHLRIRSPEKHGGHDSHSVQLRFLKEIGFSLSGMMSGLPEGLRFIIPHDSSPEEIIKSEMVQHEGRELLEITLSSPEPWASHRTDSFEDSQHLKNMPDEFAEFMIENEKQKRTLVDVKRTIRLLLDPQLNYALVERWNTRDNGDLIQHSKFLNHEQIGDTLWLPEHIEIRLHAWPESPTHVTSTPILVNEVTLTAATIDESPLPDSSFEFTYDMPGSIIIDDTHPDAADGGSVETRVAGGREEQLLTQGGARGTARPGPPRTAPSRWPRLLQANGGLLLLGLVGFLIWRRRKSTS